MKLRDIVNREHVTLTNCESEPIHIPGAIQPHGFLLTVRGERLIIAFCSGNTNEYCGYLPEQLLGRSMAECFGDSEAIRLAVYLQSEEYAAKNPLALRLGDTAYNCTIYSSGPEEYVVEAEPFPDGFRDLPDLYQQTRKFVALLERKQTLKALCQTIAEETRAITGYDRVMIYRFDQAYNGEVIAEARDEQLEPFLNLHYPHTDIPAQARALYLRNLMRMIVDVNYTPVPIYTIDDQPGKNLDLSDSVLRSVSPIHIEYLKNMGVGATLTISLVHNKRLWGLIACHHYSPKNIPHYTRFSAKLQGHFLTSQIDVREVAEAFEASRKIASAVEAVLPATIGLKKNNILYFVQNPGLLEAVNATGVAIRFDAKIYQSGETPDASDIEALCNWFPIHCEQCSSDNLSAEKGVPILPTSAASGALYHSLAAGGASCIIWFRSKKNDEVMWAGDPAKAIVKDEKGLSPRKSFALWLEQNTGQSHPWMPSEEAAAVYIAHALQKQFSLIQLGAEEERYRKLSEQLQLAYEDLERINWISTHDLQEPLRKIQIFSSKLLAEKNVVGNEAEKTDILKRISGAANRMQRLMSDVHAYSNLLQAKPALVKVLLDSVVNGVLDELDEDLKAVGAIVAKNNLPKVEGEPFLLQQVFTNLFRNSLKFANAERKLLIRVDSAIACLPQSLGHDTKRSFYRVSISDNGIGFENIYSERIFELFNRLHGKLEYEGTGVGLALCRKIMQHHNGHITAEGKPGIGATFHLWFPL